MVRSLAVLCVQPSPARTLSEERFELYKAAAGGIVCRVESQKRELAKLNRMFGGKSGVRQHQNMSRTGGKSSTNSCVAL